MTDRPTVGVAMIVRDEAAVIDRCLDSFGDHVDQIAVVDTGSTDDTETRVAAWSKAHPDVDVRTGRFGWVDDFAAARNAADDLLTTDWVSWIDADDVLHGADQLKPLAAEAPPGLSGYVMDYDYLQDPDGRCVCRLRRERLVRAGAGRWDGRVHEAKAVPGQLVLVAPERVEWRHRPKPHAAGRDGRNVRILEAWLRDEPDNPRVLVYLGREYATANRPADALDMFGRYLALDGIDPAEAAQAHRHAAVLSMMGDDWEAAKDHAAAAFRRCPEWPDSLLTLAEVAHHEREWPRAIELADRVLRGGVPETVLIVNPMDYQVQPRTIIASALAGLSRWQEAAQVARDGLALDPHRPELAQGLRVWESLGERDRLARALVDLAQAAVAHDDQLNALGMLDAAPWMVADHPEVVRCRAELRQRLAWIDRGYREHYVTGGSKPEDAVPDEKIGEVCERVSRCGFLLGGLADQAGVELKPDSDKELVA